MRKSEADRLIGNEVEPYIDEIEREVVCELKYDNVAKFIDGCATVMIGNKVGFIDENANEICPVKYTSTRAWSDDEVIPLQDGDKFGWFDRKSRYLCEPKYDEDLTWQVDKDFIVVTLNGKKGITRTNGIEVSQPQYDEIYEWYGVGYPSTIAYLVFIKDKWGVLDPNTGDYLLEPIYDEIGNEGGNIETLRIGKKWGYIYLGGAENTVSDIIYDEIKCNGQVVAYRIGEKWGVSFFLEPDSWAPEEGCAIEDAGKVIELFECKYDAVDSLYDECYYLSLSLNGKCGYFSVSRKDGSVTMVCEHKYDDICFDVDGMAAVRIGEKWGYIDKDGKAICEIKYDDVRHSAQPCCYEREDFDYPRLIAVCIDDKWGFVNTQGEEFGEFKFDRVDRWTSEYDGDMYVAYIGEQKYVLSDDGLRFEPRD